MANLRVTIAEPSADLADAWHDLISRAPGNVFVDPAGLAAASVTGFADIVMLTAWDDDIEPPRLVGAWALRHARIARFGPAYWAAPVHDYAFISNPVIDPAYAGDVMPAFLAAIKADARRPNVIRLQHLDGDAPSFAAIETALGGGDKRSLTLFDRPRPYLGGEADRKRSGSTRKKLRQDWNRLSAKGAVTITNQIAPDDVMAAFEIFLALEASSWKGRRGTAILSRPDDARFARQFIGNLAERQSASVAVMRLDDRPIATQVLLYCGRTAYTWKPAYDAEFARFSPGALLIDRISDDLLEDPRIDAIESCSPEGGFMLQMWTGRRRTVDLLVALGTRRPAAFMLLVAGVRARARLKQGRDLIQSRLKRAMGSVRAVRALSR